MNLLIHLTDPVQNGYFQDLYMDGISVDLSRAIFVFSFNDRRLVNPILLDRMEIIRFHSYTPTDKAVIIEKHLIPQVMNKYFGTKSKLKCILRNKAEILRALITPSRRYSDANKAHKANNGKVYKKKIIRGKTSGLKRQ
jgi:ATP-dependent Lon protease